MSRYSDRTTSALPAVKRFITTHDANGKASFVGGSSEDVTLKYSKPAAMHVHYATQGFPVQLSNDKDLKAFFSPSGDNLPIAQTNGTVIRMVDLGPAEQSPMHRTQSLDYGVVLDGECELVLEDWDGPVRLMKVGDVSVQRGTMHAWRNPSKDKWVRMLYILVPAEPLDGLEEDLGGIELPK